MFEWDEQQERRRKRFMAFLYLFSLMFHAGGGVALAYVKLKPPAEVLDVEIAAIQPKAEPKPEPEPEPEPTPVRKAHHAATPAPAPEAAPVAAPDFGLSLSAGGPGGIAVPTGPAPAPEVKQAVKKLVAAAAPAACAEPDTKPRPVTTGRPIPTDEARMAAIVGKVRAELTVDENGDVTGAKILEGLGHGLDEAVLIAVKAWKLAPATHCGKPVSATFVVSLKFDLSK
jgi:protein TonB